MVDVPRPRGLQLARKASSGSTRSKFAVLERNGDLSIIPWDGEAREGEDRERAA